MSEKKERSQSPGGGSEDKNVIEFKRRLSGSSPAFARGNNDTGGRIEARRAGSAAKLVADVSGTIKLERNSQSAVDLLIAVKSRGSQSTIPSLFQGAVSTGPPVMGADDAIDVLGGKGPGGAFNEHLLSFEALSLQYKSHIDEADPSKSCGLTEDLAKKLLDEFGPNVLTPPPKIPMWLLFLLQFTSYLMILLQLTCLSAFILFAIDPSNYSNLYLGILLFIVIVVTGYETFSSEAKADNLMAEFKNLVPEKALVIRDGKLGLCPATDLVVGDIVKIKLGDKIPADCRVIMTNGLKIDQAMITGESLPVDIQVEAADHEPKEAKNLVFNGSVAVEGEGYVMVVRTGDHTVMGTMVLLTGTSTKAAGTLKNDITYFVTILFFFALAQAVLVFAVALGKGLDPITVFVNGFIIILVGNVPQGLPSTVTASLLIVADKMMASNVLLKKLDIIETLGSCTCICTDKTGTLTMNLMSVSNLWVHSLGRSMDEFAKKNTEEMNFKLQNTQMSYLINVASLNSRIALEVSEKTKEKEPQGDATELGLYRYFSSRVMDRYGMDIESYRLANPKVHEVPFNSANKFQMSIHQMSSEQGGKQVLLLKGAADVLFPKCNRYIAEDGSMKPVSEAFLKLCNDAYEVYGGRAERVLAFAMFPLDKTVAEEEASNPKWKAQLLEGLQGKGPNPRTDMVFCGLVTLQDPPRAEVPIAIQECYSAGIKVVMVTGDHPLTAESIAKQIGLITQPTRGQLAKERNIDPKDVPEADIGAMVVHGINDIPKMTDEDWQILGSKKEVVFARTTPEHKLQIVEFFLKQGHITAMTGDGVNDSPAMSKASIGIAMGLNGSAVAKEAADIVLQDDNFASIVVGVREGRLLFANLKKSIAYTLTHLSPEVVPVILWALAGIPQPMGALLTLCIDLLTELLPATSIAFEDAEALIMKVPPRNARTDKLTSFPLLLYAYGIAGSIETGACMLTYYLTFQAYGISGKDLFEMNNQYFPATKPGQSYTTSDGRVYDNSEQVEILWQVQATWFYMIVAAQALHIWVVRTSTVSIFQHGLFSNKYTNIGVLTALMLGIFVIYCPGVIDIVQARTPIHITIFYGSLLVFGTLWPYAEGRKLFTRSYPHHPLNKWLSF